VNAAPAAREVAWSDERLVRECRKGNQVAWSALIEKYKNLIFSIPIKFGLPREDAADIFQAVCVDLLSSLPKLREPKAIAKWLMQTSFGRMVSMLFFDDPPRPYQEVAKELGIASGSIGFIRGRCLKKMRQLLEEKGFQ
jgi:DNA-directed RNA polymerase specialized sigma24 family protein